MTINKIVARPVGKLACNILLGLAALGQVSVGQAQTLSDPLTTVTAGDLFHFQASTYTRVGQDWTWLEPSQTQRLNVGSPSTGTDVMDFPYGCALSSAADTLSVHVPAGAVAHPLAVAVIPFTDVPGKIPGGHELSRLLTDETGNAVMLTVAFEAPLALGTRKLLCFGLTQGRANYGIVMPVALIPSFGTVAPQVVVERSTVE